MADNVEVQYSADISEFLSAMDELDQKANTVMEDVAQSANKAGEALDSSLAEGASKAKQNLQSVEESGTNLGEMFSDLKSKISTAFEAGGILLAWDAIKKVGEALEEAMAHATQINNLSDVLGISTDQFQALEEAANKAGVSMSIVTRTVNRLEEDFRLAGDGSDSARAKLMDLGFTSEQINDKLFTSSDMIKTLSDRLRDGATATITMEGITAAFGVRAKLVAEVLKEYDGSAEGVAIALSKINGLSEEQVKKGHEQHAFWSDVGQAIENTTELLGLWIAESNEMAGQGEAWLASDGKIQAAIAGTEKAVDAERAAAAEVARLDLEGRRTTVENAKAAVEATKAGTAERVAAEREYVAAIIDLDTEKSAAYKAGLTKLAVAQREYYDNQLTALYESNARAEKAQEESDQRQLEFTNKLSHDLEASMKRYWENQAREQIDSAQGQEKATIAQLDGAKKILDAQNAAQRISPSTYLTAEILLINEHRDAVIAAAKAEEAARYGAADAAAKAAKDIQIANATADAQIVAAKVKAGQEVEKNWQAVDNVIEKSLDNAFRTMLTSTGSFTANVRKSFLQLSENLIENVFNSIVKHWVEGEATKLAASESMQAILTALHLTSLITAKTTDATMAVSDITAKAAQAAAGAFAATAAIPYIGPELAPAAAAAADAEVMAFTAQIASAAGGMEVDRDQLAFVHKDEKILPAHISQGIDEKLLGNGPGGDTTTTRNTYHIAAHDAASFEKYLGSQRNRNAIAKAVVKASNRGNNLVRRSGFGGRM